MIQNARYGPEKKDYMWINNFFPRMIMHPTNPKLNRKDLTDVRDKEGTRMFMKMTKVCRDHSYGYVTYMWDYKGDKSRIVKKISFVRAFKPWGWIIGTGVYIEEINETINSLYINVLIVMGAIYRHFCSHDYSHLK